MHIRSHLSAATLRKRRLTVASAIGVALLSTIVSVAPTFAASDALDVAFATPYSTTNFIAGTVNIPTLTPGSTVSGSGAVLVTSGSTVIYSGTFTANTLKTITGFGSGPINFRPAPAAYAVSYTFPAYLPGSSYYPVVLNPVRYIGAAAASPGFGAGLQILPGLISNGQQDLFLYCSNANAVLDIGVTLSSPLSTDAIAALNNNLSGFVFTFPNVEGASAGSIC